MGLLTMAEPFTNVTSLFKPLYLTDSVSELLWAVFAGTSLVVVVCLWWQHPLYGANKGPRVYPFVGSVPEFLLNLHRMYDWETQQLKRQPNRTARITRPFFPQVLLTASPENVEYVLKTNFDNYPKGPGLSEPLFDLLGKGIFNADYSLWKMQRRVALNEFTTRTLRDFVVESVRVELQNRLMPILRKLSDSGDQTDLQDLFMRFTFDNICQLGFGVDPGCLEMSLPSVKFCDAFDLATELTMLRYANLAPGIWKLKRALVIGSEARLREAVDSVNEFAMSVITKRKVELAAEGGDGIQRSDLLSRFISLGKAGNNVKKVPTEVEEKHDVKDVSWKDEPSENDDIFTDQFLRDIIISFVLAGRDTTSAALSWLFYLLLKHPEEQRKVLEEISDIVNSRDVSSFQDPESISFTFHELRRMHHLTATVSEALRLYPPVPVDYKYTAKDDVWPDGTFVQSSSIIGYHPYAMARMVDIWGEDCEEFKPERWLKNGAFVQENPYKYPVFQAGVRICIGKDFALLQMKFIAAALIYSFKFKLADDYKAVPNLSLTMRIKDGLPVTVGRKSRAG